MMVKSHAICAQWNALPKRGIPKAPHRLKHPKRGIPKAPHRLKHPERRIPKAPHRLKHRRHVANDSPPCPDDRVSKKEDALLYAGGMTGRVISTELSSAVEEEAPPSTPSEAAEKEEDESVAADAAERWQRRPLRDAAIK